MRALQSQIGGIVDSYWAPLVVVSAFVLGGLVVFPLTIMIAATAASFGPWLGFAYALAGALASALVTYAIGAPVGGESLMQLLGKRLNAIRNRIARQGLIAVVTIRLVPIAPYTLVNLVAGASGIRLWHYVVGTILGLLPGLVLMSLLGSQVLRVITSPSLPEIVAVVLLLALWIAVVLGVQVAVSKYRSTS
jgi:phospholipase D1/2